MQQPRWGTVRPTTLGTLRLLVVTDEANRTTYYAHEGTPSLPTGAKPSDQWVADDGDFLHVLRGLGRLKREATT